MTVGWIHKEAKVITFQNKGLIDLTGITTFGVCELALKVIDDG